VNLRQLAKGQPCQIRVPGVCNFDPDTTVLCHLRMVGITGMGMKASDILGAWGCSSCHRYVDTHGIDGRTALLEGMARTQGILIQGGYLCATREYEVLERENAALKETQAELSAELARLRATLSEAQRLSTGE